MMQKRRLPRSQRVYRPLGLSIAIVATGLIYGIMPLVNIYFKWRIAAIEEGGLIGSGIDITIWDWLGGAFGLVMLALCVPAWIGRPPRIRWVFGGALAGVVVIHTFRVLQVWTEDVDPIFGGQPEQAVHNFLLCQVPILIVVPLYVLWYLNRAPARAFYRRVPLAALSKPPTPGDDPTA